MIRRIFLTAALVVSIPFLKKFCYQQTDGFAVCKIRSTLPFNEKWDTSSQDSLKKEEVLKLLDQPYYYLAKGAQSYVFVSEDQQTVIKFFRLYHLRPPFWLTAFPFPPFLQAYQLGKIASKNLELEKDFNSYIIAYNQLKEETGLLYLHLNKSKNLNKKLIIYDRLNIAHSLDLDEMEFLVQKKATLVYPHIDAMIQREGPEKAKEAISSLVQLLAERCKKGIADKDPDLNTNFGFIDHEPLQIDIGRFRIEGKKEAKEYRDEIIRITDHFRQWLDQKDLELSSHLLKEIEKVQL